MAKFLFIAQADCCDPAQEKEFTDWMDNIHIPDVLATPGIVRAARYLNINPEENKRPICMVIYEIETDDISKFSADLHQTIGNIVANGRVLKSAMPEQAYPFATPFYKRVKNFEKSS